MCIQIFVNSPSLFLHFCFSFFFFPRTGSTYPNGLAAGSINGSGGVKNPIASAGSSNKSSIVSTKNPVPSAPSAKEDDFDFDSMQVQNNVICQESAFFVGLVAFTACFVAHSLIQCHFRYFGQLYFSTHLSYPFSLCFCFTPIALDRREL